MRRHILAFGLIIVAVLLTAAQCSLLDPGIEPTPDPTPTPGATLFFDDFEGAADPAWGFASGVWDVPGGQLDLVGSGSGASAFVMTGTSWDDYKVEVGLSGLRFSWLGTRVGVICRALDDRNKIVFWVDKDSAYFAIYEDGEEVASNLGKSTGSTAGSFNMSVSVVGSTYIGAVNGITRAEMTDARFVVGTGGIAGRLADDVSFDNFRVTALE